MAFPSEGDAVAVSGTAVPGAPGTGIETSTCTVNLYEYYGGTDNLCMFGLTASQLGHNIDRLYGERRLPSPAMPRQRATPTCYLFIAHLQPSTSLAAPIPSRSPSSLRQEPGRPGITQRCTTPRTARHKPIQHRGFRLM